MSICEREAWTPSIGPVVQRNLKTDEVGKPDRRCPNSLDERLCEVFLSWTLPLLSVPTKELLILYLLLSILQVTSSNFSRVGLVAHSFLLSSRRAR